MAIHGGQPVRRKYLPYGRQWIDEQDIEAVVETLKGDFLTTGPAVEKFEQAIATYVGAKYAIAFANGTSALHGAVYAAGVSEGDQVITTPMTFAASANCILYQRGIPVFADVDQETGLIDPDRVEELVNTKTKAIIPVDYTGRPVNMIKIMDIAKRYGFTVIEDAAHAFGASYKGKRVGSLADMTMFSFHPVKHITTGEGGIITTDSDEYYDRLCHFRTHGIVKEKEKLPEFEGPWYHEMQELGFNYRLTDIQAALGLSQLQRSNEFIERRRSFVQLYRGELKSEQGIILPPESAESSWHLFVIQAELNKLTVGRREVFEALLAENIGVNVHYIPVYRHPYYRNLGYPQGLCPNAEEFYRRIITLPLFPYMTIEDCKDVIRAIRKVIRHYLR